MNNPYTIGKTDDCIDRGFIGTVSLWCSDPPYLYDSGKNLDALAAADLYDGKFVCLTFGKALDAEGREYTGWIALPYEV